MRRFTASMTILALLMLLMTGVRASSAQTDPPAPIAPSENTGFIPLPLSQLEADTDYAVQWMRLLYNRVEGERRNVPQAARAWAERRSLAVRDLLRGYTSPG